MATLRRILVPTDFSPSADVALGSALALARRHDAEVWLLRVIVVQTYDPFTPGYHHSDPVSLREYLERAALRAMGEALERHDAEGLTVRPVCVGHTKAAPAIVEYASVKAVDLIAMGTHGRQGMQHLLLGSTAEEVVRRAPCSVLVAREAAGERAPASWRRLLLPVDFSEHSRQAFPRAVALAQEHGAELHLLHVTDPGRDFRHPSHHPGSGAALEAEARKASHARLGRLVAQGAGGSVAMKTHATVGQPAREIVEIARKEQIDLITIPTHGLSGVTRFLLGSVAEKVVRHSPCPVWVLKALIEEKEV